MECESDESGLVTVRSARSVAENTDSDGIRERAATIDKSEKIRPPRRKRRPSYEVAVTSKATPSNDSGAGLILDAAGPVSLSAEQIPDLRRATITVTCTNSAEDIMTSPTCAAPRSGSVPPLESRRSPGFLTTPPNYQGGSDTLAPPPSLEEPSKPAPVPRIRRLSNRQKLALGFGHTHSNPASGANTPDIVGREGGSSALDLSDLAPFGPANAQQTAVGRKKGQRNSFRSVRSPATPSSAAAAGSTGSRGWNWIWNRHHPGHNNNNNGGGHTPQTADVTPSQSHGGGHLLRHTGSLLGRKRKSRHISCPDISSASDDASSRSTSPVTFKVSLTSLFGGQKTPASGTPPSNNSASCQSSSSFKRPLHVSVSSGAGSGSTGSPHRLSVTSRNAVASAASLTPRPIVTEQLVVDALAAESVTELQAVQYCQITDPYEAFFVEYCDVAYCSDDFNPTLAPSRLRFELRFPLSIVAFLFLFLQNTITFFYGTSHYVSTNVKSIKWQKTPENWKVQGAF